MAELPPLINSSTRKSSLKKNSPSPSVKTNDTMTSSGASANKSRDIKAIKDMMMKPNVNPVDDASVSLSNETDRRTSLKDTLTMTSSLRSSGEKLSHPEEEIIENEKPTKRKKKKKGRTKSSKAAGRKSITLTDTSALSNRSKSTVKMKTKKRVCKKKRSPTPIPQSKADDTEDDIVEDKTKKDSSSGDSDSDSKCSSRCVCSDCMYTNSINSKKLNAGQIGKVLGIDKKREQEADLSAPFFKLPEAVRFNSIHQINLCYCK
jgi:hypothetical protein